MQSRHRVAYHEPIGLIDSFDDDDAQVPSQLNTSQAHDDLNVNDVPKNDGIALSQSAAQADELDDIFEYDEQDLIPHF